MQHADFYRALGFEIVHGGEDAPFTSLRAGRNHLNFAAQPARKQWCGWGRVIFHVADVDALHERALAAGCRPAATPRDAEWGERFFHLTDPDGHELSFARPLSAVARDASIPVGRPAAATHPGPMDGPRSDAE
jgi:catechol 2,3-dioxygenase-like lactoylglutathione lyase family enzyme